jgi:hypothetical protein
MIPNWQKQNQTKDAYCQRNFVYHFKVDEPKNMEFNSLGYVIYCDLISNYYFENYFEVAELLRATLKM